MTFCVARFICPTVKYSLINLTYLALRSGLLTNFLSNAYNLFRVISLELPRNFNTSSLVGNRIMNLLLIGDYNFIVTFKKRFTIFILERRTLCVCIIFYFPKFMNCIIQILSNLISQN